MVQYTAKVLFQLFFFYLLISFEDKKEVLAFFTCILDLNLENSNCKLKPNTNFVYITKHCAQCISIITRLLMVNFGGLLVLVLLKDFNYLFKKKL